MNIRYTSLYFVGGKMMSQLKASVQSNHVVPDPTEVTEESTGLLKRTHRRNTRIHRNTFDLNSQPISVQFMCRCLVSCNDRRYSSEISPRLSSDPAHYVRVREVREGVTETLQREAPAPRKPASSPVNLPRCAALDWPDIPSFSV